MIRTSSLVAVAMFGLSLTAHGAALMLSDRPDTPMIEGGAVSSVAQLGNSFQDMAVGVMTPPPPPETTAQTPETVQEKLETQTLQQPQAAPQTTAEPAQPASQTQPPPTALQPVQTAQTSAPLAPLRPSTVPALIPAVQPPPAAQTALPQPDAEPPRVSRRPALRPKTVEQTAALSKPKQAKPKPKKPKPNQAKPKPRGNAKIKASAGTNTGQKKAAAATAAARKAKAATRAANAAASNYPGAVMRRLARQKRPRVASKGTAIISFSVTAGGGVARVGIARSSGSAQLDKAALALVRRAGPFPKPPAGAQRAFKVRIKGR